MYAETWDCTKCHHGEEYKCPLKHDDINREELYERLWWEGEGLEPLIFTADRLGICPRCLVTDWGAYLWQAFQWQESGGELGLSFIDCPRWLYDAFNLLATERYKANALKNKK